MTKSNTTSPLGHARIGDYRLITPYPMQSLPLWLLGRIWPDANDRKTLIQFQRAVRTSPPQPTKKAAKPWAAAYALNLALNLVSMRHLLQNQYECRWSFAAAVQRQATAYKITEPFDFYGAYAGLVSRPFDATDDLVALYGTEPKDMQVMILLGVTGVDSRLMAGDSPDEIAKEVCRELIDAFSCGEYTAEDRAMIGFYDTSIADAVAERKAEEEFIERVGG